MASHNQNYPYWWAKRDHPHCYGLEQLGTRDTMNTLHRTKCHSYTQWGYLTIRLAAPGSWYNHAHVTELPYLYQVTADGMSGNPIPSHLEALCKPQYLCKRQPTTTNLTCHTVNATAASETVTVFTMCSFRTHENFLSVSFHYQELHSHLLKTASLQCES